jgi:uncharacterized membrane protein
MAQLRADPLFILTVLSALVVLAEWLGRRGAGRHLGAAVIVILLGAVASNTGLIPAGSTADAPVPVYDIIFSVVAPIAIFWLLLPVNLRDVLRAGLPLVLLFLLGSAGTMLGAVIGMRVIDGASTIGELHGPVAGMFAGTYIGGSVNFNAVALQYGVVKQGALYAGSIVVDNIITTIWILITLAVPRLLIAAWPRRRHATAAGAQPIVDLDAESETLNPRGLALVLTLGVAALWVSNAIADRLARMGINFPAILVISVIALALAQSRPVSRLPGVRVLGMYAVYLFLAVIGVFCDARSFATLGRLGPVLLAFAGITVLVHGIVTFGAAWLFRMDLDGAAVASQANVGGSTFALALAKSLGREDLLVPGILLGSLGNAIGTFLGFIVVRWT